MLLAVNLMVCLFFLCIFGVLDKPLKELSMRPAAGSFVCLATAGLLLLEDIPLTDALYANFGGFFVPLMAAIALCANARQGSRIYLLLMGVLIGIGTWMFNQITSRALESLQENAALFGAMFCLLFANILDHETKPVLMMSIIGFLLSDIIGYIVAIASGQSAYLILGDGIKAVMVIMIAIGSVLICRLRRAAKTTWAKHTKHKTAQSVQPEAL